MTTKIKEYTRLTDIDDSLHFSPSAEPSPHVADPDSIFSYAELGKYPSTKDENASKKSFLGALKAKYGFITLLVLSTVGISLLWLDLTNNIFVPNKVDKNENLNFLNMKSVRITLLGDSLINNPYRMFDLAGRIRKRLSPRAFVSLYDEGDSGNTIADILNRLDNVLLIHQAHGLILFWDSDCSDVDESSMSSEQVSSLRENYQQNLREVLNRTITFGTDVIAVAGPGLLNEPGYFFPNFGNKESMLNDYRAMNRAIAQEFDLPYIDIRKAFLDAIPSSWIFARWYLTMDGEHENSRGTTIVADHFASAINDWLEKKRSHFDEIVSAHLIR